MGFFSDVDIQIMDMVHDGATREQVAIEFPFISMDEIEQYFTGDHDGDYSCSSHDSIYDDDYIVIDNE